MPIGLKRGVVELADHDPEWERLALDTIEQLWRAFGPVAKDIQHVGSTAIRGIKAKPVIDIAVAVDDFDAALALSPALDSEGFIFRGWEGQERQPVFQCGEYVPGEKGMRLLTHYIHVVLANSRQWHNYINFRDYMNASPAAAGEYESHKLKSALKSDNLSDYHSKKQDFVVKMIEISCLWHEFGRTFTKIEPIAKGWSSDKKYYIETADGRRLLLRVADMAEHDRKKTEFDMMRRVSAMGIPMSQPIGFGVCDGGEKAYQLLSWIDGEDAEAVLPIMTETEQYVLGLKAGELLRKIHSVPSPDILDNWSARYFKVIDERIEAYKKEGVLFDGSELILDYLDRNRYLLNNRPQCFLHGDYHEGNLMIGADGELYVIDWLDDGFGNYGDPWHDFEAICGNGNAYFSTGFVRGYFGGEPPRECWDVLSYYTVTSALTSIVWRKYHRPEELPESLRWNESNAQSIRGGCSSLMKWYLKDFYIQYIDGVPLKLKSPFDLGFIHRYGTVFKVFDDQDSGNLCFGVRAGDGRRYFVKFAGAPTEQYKGDPADAIARLRETVPIYQDLAHPTLIRFVKAEEIGCGYATVFEWVDAVCAHGMYQKDSRIFDAFPLETKQRIFADIMEFHAHVAAKGYVAIDFYDGCIMYDLENKRTVICDVDFYAKTPYVNSMGRLWGSTRFMSPEEFQAGAVIDEVTNVYGMGAAAFCLLADSDRSFEKWPLPQGLYAVAKKAASDERSRRQQSIRELIEEWEAAK